MAVAAVACGPFQTNLGSLLLLVSIPPLIWMLLPASHGTAWRVSLSGRARFSYRIGQMERTPLGFLLECLGGPHERTNSSQSSYWGHLQVVVFPPSGRLGLFSPAAVFFFVYSHRRAAGRIPSPLTEAKPAAGASVACGRRSHGGAAREVQRADPGGGLPCPLLAQRSQIISHLRWLCLSKPWLTSPILVGIGEFTTHFRRDFSGDWDVHWG